MAASEEAEQKLFKWVNKTNEHFARCDQEIFGDAKAWFDIYHDPEITNDLVYDWLDWMEVIKLHDPSLVSPRTESIFNDARKYLENNWSKSRCFDKGLGRHRNQPLFKCFMEMKDLINKITKYNPPEVKKKPPEDPPTPFERLFDY